jgi:hypothetical protein
VAPAVASLGKKFCPQKTEVLVLLHFLIISFIVLKYFVVIGTNKINQQQPIEPSLPVEIQGIVYSERVVVKKYTHVKILVKRGW